MNRKFMKDLIIFGNGDFARMMKYYIEKDDKRRVVAFAVNAEYITQGIFCDLPLVEFETIDTQYPPEQYDILLAIGNSKMNEVRKNVFRQCKQKGYTIASYIHSGCSIHCENMGEGNIILERCLVYPFTKIGDGNLFWDNVMIAHDCTVGNFNTLAAYTDLCGYVQIGNNSFLGKNCVIKEYTKIADYTLVGATAYVDKDTKPYDVVVPARSIVLENKKSTDLM